MRMHCVGVLSITVPPTIGQEHSLSTVENPVMGQNIQAMIVTCERHRRD
jgi:hypothetical protein